MKIPMAALIAALGLLPALASAQTPPDMAPRPIPPIAEPGALPLYKGVAPGSEGDRQVEQWTRIFGYDVVRNVTRPQLTPFLPKAGTATGAAVIVLPGGGFVMESMDNEGWAIAKRLAARGVAAFVLKYRIDATPVGEQAFFGAMMGKVPKPDTDKPGIDVAMFDHIVPKARADGQEALRMVRTNAAKWGIDPGRVGMMGFSAGAITTMAVARANDPGARPDFIAPIYGSMVAIAPPANPQPLFAALASDDIVFARQGFGLIDSWQKAGGSVELHYYESGAHGFGAQTQGKTSDLWFEQFMAWLASRGLLKPAAAK